MDRFLWENCKKNWYPPGNCPISPSSWHFCVDDFPSPVLVLWRVTVSNSYFTSKSSIKICGPGIVFFLEANFWARKKECQRSKQVTCFHMLQSWPFGRNPHDITLMSCNFSFRTEEFNILQSCTFIV